MGYQSERQFSATKLGPTNVETYTMSSNRTRERVTLEVEGEPVHFGIEPHVADEVERYRGGLSPELEISHSSLGSVLVVTLVGLLVGLPMAVLGWSDRARARFVA